MRDGRRDPHRIGNGDGILEVPITVTTAWAKPMCFFAEATCGCFLTGWSARWPSGASGSRPVVFYIHPREIDPAHPRLPMNRKRQFKTYVNLQTTEWKVRQILRDFPVTTFQNVISNHPQLVDSMSLDRTQRFFHQYANDFDAIYGNQNGMIDSVINRFFPQEHAVALREVD